MDKLDTLSTLTALSQETRLDVFRLLIKSGHKGMLSGEIGESLSVRQNTMSTNLAVLLNANLVSKQREGRTIRYFVNFKTVRGMLAYLLEDCCGGHPESCQPLIAQLTNHTPEESF